ncbi:YggT family protein [bacterium]|nr:YggT family protein [bacterium]
MIKILKAIDYCFYIYMMMILVRCLLTWFPNVNWQNPVLNALRSSVDLYLDFFRKFIPPVAMFDLSPIVAMIVLMILERVCLFAAYIFLSALGVS